MVLVSTILSRVSCIKQNMFCSTNTEIYKFRNIIPTITPKIPVQFKIISKEEDIMNFSNFPEIKNHLWKFKYYLNRGSQLYLAFVADDLAGYYLLTDLGKHKPFLFNYHPLFSDGQCYFISHCQTLTKYRKNGIYSYMLIRMCENSVSNGGSVFISTNLNNKFSQKGIENAGFEKSGSLRYIQLFRFVLLSKFVGVNETNTARNGCEVL